MDNYYLGIIFLSIAGFFISLYIGHKKKKKETLVCPMKANCSQVIHSSFSKFLGIPVEYLGMAYYGSLASGYILKLGGFSPPGFGYLLLAMTTGAFLFSVYLTFVQIFALHQYCSWCLISALLSTIIFIFAVIGSLDSVIPFLQSNHELLTWIHLLGVAIGLGAATIADLFFFKFLKDFRISEFEADTLQFISQTIWLALGLIVMSGLGLFLGDITHLSQSPTFMVKMISIFVIIVNGAMLNLLVAPKLVQITFRAKHAHHQGELARLRNLAFTFGPISLLSWYFAFTLGAFRQITLDFFSLLALYFSLLVLAIALGTFLKHFMIKKAVEHSPRDM